MHQSGIEHSHGLGGHDHSHGHGHHGHGHHGHGHDGHGHDGHDHDKHEHNGHKHKHDKHGHSHNSSDDSYDSNSHKILIHSDDDDECEHNHDSHHTKEDTRNINVRSAFIHTIGDLLQSIGVLIAAILIWIDEERFHFADPICTLLFAIIVLFTTSKLLRDALNILMESVPPHIDTEKLSRRYIFILCINIIRIRTILMMIIYYI